MIGNVGDVLSESKDRALKGMAVAASVLVYVAGLVYAGVHNYTLMTRGVPADLLIWAILGVVALEISALILPIALHWWTHSPMQRFAAFGFYLVDLGLLFFNVVTDYGLTAGTDLPAWAGLYLSYIVPATPLLAALGWSIIWLLDPSERERAMQESLKASTREALSAKIAVAAREADIEGLVEQAARRMVFDIVGATLAGAERRALPRAGSTAGTVEGVAIPTARATQSPLAGLDAEDLATLRTFLDERKRKANKNGHNSKEAAQVAKDLHPKG